MRILVTGANGYIGRHVVRCLCDMTPDNEVFAVDFCNDGLDSRAKFLNVDILAECNNKGLFEKLNKPDVCIHLAWQDGFNHESASHIDNLAAHFHFLRNLVDHGCNSVSVMGSMHEVGYWKGEVNSDTPCNPLSMYGVAKNALRQALLNYCEGKAVSLKWLRGYYITGDDAHSKSVFSKVLQAAKNGQKTFPCVSDTNRCDFIDIELLAKYITVASLQNKIDGIINVCSGKTIALKDKMNDFIKERRLDIHVDYGTFSLRKYDSPVILGNTELIGKIMKNYKEK